MTFRVSYDKINTHIVLIGEQNRSYMTLAERNYKYFYICYPYRERSGPRRLFLSQRISFFKSSVALTDGFFS